MGPTTPAEAKRRLVRILPPLLVLLGLGLLALAEGMSDEPAPSNTFVAGGGPQVLRGAETYDLICSDCHGNSGLGIAEGRLSFLPEHRNCERCHRPFNPPTKIATEISHRNAFNIGTPPPLRGTLAHFGTAEALYGYIKSAMPRYDPGALTEEQYLDITAFLLELNGALPDGLTLTEANMAEVPLR